MKIFHIILFIFIVVIALLALLIEVVNPHSSLNAIGAFLRGGGILFIIPLWAWISKRGKKQLKIPGIIFLLIISMAYLLYGFSDLRQNAIYEKQRSANQEISK